LVKMLENEFEVADAVTTVYVCVVVRRNSLQLTIDAYEISEIRLLLNSTCTASDDKIPKATISGLTLMFYNSFLPRLRRGLFRRYIPLRRYVPGSRLLPTVIIGGAQKAGTTFLFDVIARQVTYSGPVTKEVHYFSSEWFRDDLWYRAHFERAGSPRLQIEGSASYLYHPNAAMRIAKTLPNVKIIFVLRDPIARAYSHYHHNSRWSGREKLSFPDALQAERTRLEPDLERLAADPNASVESFYRYSYVNRGKYAEQVERFMNVFDPEQLLLVDSDKLFRGCAIQLGKIDEFLGARLDWSAARFARTNANSYNKIDSSAWKYLAAQFVCHDEALCDLTGSRWSWMCDQEVKRRG